MWNPDHRAACNRRGLRYPSDLTDAEWALVAPLIPPAKRGGRPHSVNVREVLNGRHHMWTPPLARFIGVAASSAPFEPPRTCFDPRPREGATRVTFAWLPRRGTRARPPATTPSSSGST
jgi:hypothetical protein